MAKKPVNKGEIITMKLDNLAYGGDMVGRVDNFAIFVSGGLPGEIVKVKITQVKKNYGRGKLVDIVEPSQYRITAPCDVYTGCGGCQLQHADYQQQLKFKRQIVEDAMERIGGLEDVTVHPPLASDQQFYRNKAQFPLGVQINDKGEEEIVTGFYAPGSHDIIPNDNCQIQHPLINRIVRETLKILNQEGISVYNEELHKGLLRHLVVRVGVCTNQGMLVFVTNGDKFSEGEKIANMLLDRIPELNSVLQNINTQKTNRVMGNRTRLIAGSEKIIDYIGKLKFEISARSFFQVNTLQSKVLYDKVLDYAQLSGEELVLDAYCGIGTISLYLAQQAGVVHGIEVVQEAIKDAEMNSSLNGLENTFFYTGLVEKILPRLVDDGLEFDVVVVDPPRKGCHEDVLKAFGETGPDRIVYVSCNPTTLARDIKELVEYGYRVEEIQPVDMFPHTFHIENVALLVK